MSEATEEYIETGETNHTSYRAFELEDNIKKTAERVPERLDLLLSDIQLLKEARRDPDIDFGLDDWLNPWYRIIGETDAEYKTKEGTEELTKQETEKLYVYTESEDNLRPSSGLFDFGELLGRIASEAFIASGRDGKVYEEQADIIWGFINSLLVIQGDEGLAPSSEERRDVAEFITGFIEKRAEKEAKIDGMGAEEKNKGYENQEKAEEKIRQILEENDLEFNWAGVRNNFEDKYIPADTPEWKWYAEVDIGEKVTEERILTMLREVRAEEKVQVTRGAWGDIEELEGKKWRGVEATEILGAMHESQRERFTLAQINNEIHEYREHTTQNRSKDYTRQISKLVKELSNDEWFHPLIEKNSQYWTLTKYGEFMYTSEFGFIGEDERPHIWDRSEQVLEGVIDELEL